MTKEKLESLQGIEKELRDLKDRIEEIETCNTIRSPTSWIGLFEQQIKNDYAEKFKELTKHKKEILDFINQQESSLCLILRYRYIDYFTIEKTAELMGLSFMTINRRIDKLFKKK